MDNTNTLKSDFDSEKINKILEILTKEPDYSKSIEEITNELNESLLVLQTLIFNNCNYNNNNNYNKDSN